VSTVCALIVVNDRHKDCAPRHASYLVPGVHVTPTKSTYRRVTELAATRGLVGYYEHGEQCLDFSGRFIEGTKSQTPFGS
jgi:hypothetical protein